MSYSVADSKAELTGYDLAPLPHLNMGATLARQRLLQLIETQAAELDRQGITPRPPSQDDLCTVFNLARTSRVGYSSPTHAAVSAVVADVLADALKLAHSQRPDAHERLRSYLLELSDNVHAGAPAAGTRRAG